jgi:hypothetical protein
MLKYFMSKECSTNLVATILRKVIGMCPGPKSELI